MDLTKDQLKQLEILKGSEGWGILKNIFEKEMSILSKQILKDFSGKNNKIEYTKNDLWKLKLDCLESFMESPEKFINKSTTVVQKVGYDEAIDNINKAYDNYIK